MFHLFFPKSISNQTCKHLYLQLFFKVRPKKHLIPVSTQPTKLSWWSIKEWLAAQSLLTTDKQEVALPLGWGTACHRVCLFVGWTTQYHDPDASPVGEPVALQPPSLIKVLLRLSDCREIKHIKGKVKRIMHRWQTYKIVMHIPEGNDS